PIHLTSSLIISPNQPHHISQQLSINVSILIHTIVNQHNSHSNQTHNISPFYSLPISMQNLYSSKSRFQLLTPTITTYRTLNPHLSLIADPEFCPRNVRFVVLIPPVLTVRRLDFKRARYGRKTDLQLPKTVGDQLSISHEFPA
ncbi:hypothetical protein LINPERPRIM_LOCUS19698, partial [Linum perenne]